tara:strand:- start:4573 stop:6855 length:2283 start_codon:yes stop_codon:yes gene_type:complete
MANNIVHSFTVNQVERSYDVLCRMNIKKRVERLDFRSTLPGDSFAISYARGNNTSPLYNMYVSNKSDSLTQNRDDETIQTDTIQYIEDSTSRLLITDIFVDESPTQPETALFFVHTLENFNDGLTDWSNLSLVTVNFLDEELVPIATSEFYADEDDGCLYNNFENTYDPLTGVYGAVFVQYSVRDSTGVSTYLELISNSRVYDEATWDHLTPTGTLDPTFKRYLLTTAVGGASYRYEMPSLTKFAWRRGRETTLSILDSGDTGMEFPWYLQINKSEIQAPQPDSLGVDKNYKYYIAEFADQSFSPYPPYRFVRYETVALLNDRLMKVHHGVVKDTTKSLYIWLTFLDASGVVVGYATNDAANIGGTYNTFTVAGIESVDRKHGFVHLTDDMLTTAVEVRADYYTTDEYYDFNEYNFNPVSNLAALSQKIVLYVSPESLSTGTLTDTVHYLVVDDLGHVIYSSQAAGATAPYDFATNKLLLEDFFADGTASHTFNYNYPSTTSGLYSRASGLGLPDEFSFEDKYTVDSVLFDETVVSGVSLSGVILENHDENTHFLVLGEIEVGPSVAADDLFRYDTRLPGGGIKEENINAAIAEQPEAIWFADIAEANIYPGMASVVVHVPHEIVDTYGGAFSHDQIRAVVEKHQTGGGYAVIRSYGLDPCYTGLVGWSGVAELHWPSYGAGFDYRVGYSVDKKAWTYDELADTGGANTKLWSDLAINQQYYFSLEAWNSDSSIWEPGEIIRHRVGVNPDSAPVVLGSVT